MRRETSRVSFLMYPFVSALRCLMRRRLVTTFRIEDGATDKALTA
jgi:hypothetical protein